MGFNSVASLQDCDFYNNSAGQAGAINMQINATATLNNCSFTKNKARAGGALTAGWNVTLHLDNCIFQANVASYVGAAIVLTKSVTLYMNKSLIFNHTCKLSVIRGENQTYIHLDNSSIVNNTG